MQYSGIVLLDQSWLAPSCVLFGGELVADVHSPLLQTMKTRALVIRV